MTIETSSQSSVRVVRGIVIGGLLAGMGDILYAIVALHFRGRSALWTLQSVASGLLGKNAFEAGLASGLLGLAAQFTIAMGAAVTYWAGARKIPLLRERPMVAGPLFGVLVFLFMDFVVLPLSAFPFHLKYPLRAVLEGFLSHALLVGMPIALSLRHFGGLSPNPALRRTPRG